MRWTILILLSLIPFCIHAQAPTGQKELYKTLAYLQQNCPDSIKQLIKSANDEELKTLSKGGHPAEQMINKLLFKEKNENPEPTALRKEFESRSISDGHHQVEVVLLAFNRRLNGKANEVNAIQRPYILTGQRWKRQAAKRFTTDTLFDVYIPKDLDDCMRILDASISETDKAWAKQQTEAKFSSEQHMILGLGMRNNWSLWGGSRLSDHFNKMGIFHPDDMSGIICKTYHRHLTGQPSNTPELTEYYINYWEGKRDLAIDPQIDNYWMEKLQPGDTLRFTPYSSLATFARNNAHEDCINIGLIKEVNKDNLQVKVQLLKSCERKGIPYYTNIDYLSYDRKNNKWSKPETVTKYIKEGEAEWFHYRHWDLPQKTEVAKQPE